jgi:hypothetical protein
MSKKQARAFPLTVFPDSDLHLLLEVGHDNVSMFPCDFILEPAGSLESTQFPNSSLSFKRNLLRTQSPSVLLDVV